MPLKVKVLPIRLTLPMLGGVEETTLMLPLEDNALVSHDNPPVSEGSAMLAKPVTPLLKSWKTSPAEGATAFVAKATVRFPPAVIVPLTTSRSQFVDCPGANSIEVVPASVAFPPL